MKINVKKLDATIAKLQELRRLAMDADLANFVQVTGGKSGQRGASLSEAATNGNGHGALKTAVLAAIETFSGNFTIKAVFEQMKQQGHEFTTDTAEKSVANVLRALVAESAISVAVPGKGRRATEYKV